MIANDTNVQQIPNNIKVSNYRPSAMIVLFILYLVLAYFFVPFFHFSLRNVRDLAYLHTSVV